MKVTPPFTKFGIGPVTDFTDFEVSNEAYYESSQGRSRALAAGTKDKPIPTRTLGSTGVKAQILAMGSSYEKPVNVCPMFVQHRHPTADDPEGSVLGSLLFVDPPVSLP